TVPYTTPFRSADLVQHPACQLVQYRVITGERRLRTRPVHHQVGETQLLRALGGLPESGHARQGIGRAGIGVEVPANVPRVAPRLVQRVVEGRRELGDAPPPFLRVRAAATRGDPAVTQACCQAHRAGTVGRDEQGNARLTRRTGQIARLDGGEVLALVAELVRVHQPGERFGEFDEAIGLLFRR